MNNVLQAYMFSLFLLAVHSRTIKGSFFKGSPLLVSGCDLNSSFTQTPPVMKWRVSEVVTGNTWIIIHAKNPKFGPICILWSLLSQILGGFSIIILQVPTHAKTDDEAFVSKSSMQDTDFIRYFFFPPKKDMLINNKYIKFKTFCPKRSLFSLIDAVQSFP